MDINLTKFHNFESLTNRRKVRKILTLESYLFPKEEFLYELTVWVPFFVTIFKLFIDQLFDPPYDLWLYCGGWWWWWWWWWAYFLILNQSPYPRFEVPKIDSLRPNNNSQSPKLDSQTHEIDF